MNCKKQRVSLHPVLIGVQGWSRMLAAFATILMALASSEETKAELIRVESPIGWSANTGTGGFEGPTPPLLDVERGTLAITYATVFPDTDPSPDVGMYPQAIVDFRMFVEQETRPDLEFVLSQPGLIIIAHPSGPPIISFVAQTRERYGNFQDMLFRIDLHYYDLLSFSDALPTPDFYNTHSASFYPGVGTGVLGFNVHETDFFFAPSAHYISDIPEPSSIGLLSLGLGGLIAAVRVRVRVHADASVRKNVFTIF